MSAVEHPPDPAGDAPSPWLDRAVHELLRGGIPAPIRSGVVAIAVIGLLGFGAWKLSLFGAERPAEAPSPACVIVNSPNARCR